jgi:hypothetical protein
MIILSLVDGVVSVYSIGKEVPQRTASTDSLN